MNKSTINERDYMYHTAKMGCGHLVSGVKARFITTKNSSSSFTLRLSFSFNIQHHLGIFGGAAIVIKKSKRNKFDLLVKKATKEEIKAGCSYVFQKHPEAKKTGSGWMRCAWQQVTVRKNMLEVFYPQYELLPQKMLLIRLAENKSDSVSSQVRKIKNKNRKNKNRKNKEIDNE